MCSLILARDANISCRYLSVRRSDYQEVLHKAALETGCELRLGQKVVDINEVVPSVQLQDGTIVYGDIVVVADGRHPSLSSSIIVTTRLTIPGIKSALRQMVIPEEDTAALSQPLSTYRAWAPIDALNTNEQVAALLSQPATNVWLGPGRHMIVYPAEAGRILAINGTYPSRNDSAGEWNKAASVDEIQQRFHDFDAVAKAILSQALDCKSWALAEVPRLPRWRSKSGKVLLIGDAAHGMLQFLAQGAAMATEDAGALAECVKDLGPDGDIPRAIYYYERSRKWRGERVQSQARRNGEFIHMPDGEEQEHRDRKLAGKPLSTDQDVDCGPLLDPSFTSWLYGHDTIEHTCRVLGKI